MKVFLSFFSLSVPGGVRNLTLLSQGTEKLGVGWVPAVGDVDHYEVQIVFNDIKVFHPVTLSSSTTQHVLSLLTPGRLYKITVSTFSGPNLSTCFIEGRTGNVSTSVCDCLSLCLSLSLYPTICLSASLYFFMTLYLDFYS